MTEALLNKYLQGSCNEEEILEVEQWLYNSETRDLDEVLLRIWNGGYPVMPAEQQQGLWSRLRSATSKESTAISRESAAISRESTAISRESTAISRESTAISRESAATSRESTATSRENSASSREGAAISRESPVIALHPEKPARGIIRHLSTVYGSGRKAVVAASILVLLTSGLIWAYKRSTNVAPAVIATTGKSSNDHNGAITWASIINTGVGDKKIGLEDGSEVVLGRGSVLRYIKNFEKDRRSLYLDGKGLFKVAKDQQRPFTVYSGDIATTALGTVFRVAADSGRNISVHLYQGRVAVHSWRSASITWNDIYLSPGEELLYDSRKMTASVNRSGDHPQGSLAGRDRRADNGELRFSNAPLSEVFETLMMHYHQKIDYRKADIIHMDFTGSLSGKDSLSIILRAIANMNQLGMVQRDDVFVIRKSPR